MKCLVYTPFRCGSSYLVRYLERCLNVRASFVSDITDADHIVVKAHNEKLSSFNHIQFDHIFTCIRNPTEIYPSAFFKDMRTGKNNPAVRYPYYVEGDVTNMDSLVQSFLSHQWNSYPWLNYNFNFQQLYSLTGIDLWNEKFDCCKGAQTFGRNLHVLTHPFIFNDFFQFQAFMLNCIGCAAPDNHYSFRNSDTYGEEYQNFLNLLPDSYYQQYKEEDSKIRKHFFNA